MIVDKVSHIYLVENCVDVDKIAECVNLEGRAVADPEGVHWVPWNPSFEELPSKILCANILRTRRSHWSYALQLHISNNARVSTPLSRIRRAHDLCSRIMSEASERIKAKVLFVYYIFPLQLRMAMYQYESAYFPTPYADNQLLSVA